MRSSEKRTVLMAGPASSVKGGIRTVVDQYLLWKNWGQMELLYIPTYIEGSNAKKLFFFIGGFLRIIWTCITRHVDILHMHVSERGSFWRKALLLCVCRTTGAKTVLHHHGAEFFDFYEKASAPAKRIISGVIERADDNIVLSNYHCQRMQSIFPKGKFTVLYNAVDATGGDMYDPEARGIAFVGRLGSRKGTYDLIKVMEEVEDILPSDIRFFFCGDGEVEQVSRLLHEKGLMHRVEHLGWCSKEQLGHILSEAMLYILPSYHEGLPMSLLEAMYAGIPCIASNVDAIPEAIQSGCNGILIEPGNLEQIKNALLWLVQNQDARRSIGEKAYKTICVSFILEKHIERLKTLYMKLKDDENDGKTKRQDI